jgi:hypothetical protein
MGCEQYPATAAAVCGKHKGNSNARCHVFITSLLHNALVVQQPH